MTNRTSGGPPTRRAVLRAAGGLSLVGAAGTVSAAPTPATAAFDDWYAGELHAHTTHSHDVCGERPCEEPHTYGHTVGEQVANAEERGLDFLALTDHNTVAQQADPAFESGSVTLLDSYEHSLARGHGGFHGVTRTYDRPTTDVGRLRAVLDAVHADGGLGVINHPRTGISATWEYAGPGGMDAVEVWSITWYFGGDVPEWDGTANRAARAFYDRLLNDGHRLAAVGGSDNHWKATAALQGVGQPTTWVRAPARDEAAILDGVRAGRTFVSADWRGPKVALAVDGSSRTGRIGDVVRATGTVPVRVTVAGGAGHRVRLIADGATAGETVVPTTPYTWETTITASDGSGDGAGTDWVRAEVLASDRTMRALTSPVYLVP